MTSDEVPPETETPAAVRPSTAPRAGPPAQPPGPPEGIGFPEPGPTGPYRAIPGVPSERSNYLDYLPGVYRESQFLGRFLLVFESILGPIERTVDNISHYLDPALTPPECVAWLGSWLGLVLDERWPEGRRRELISSAVELYQWRGTRRGLSEFVRLYTGITPEIVELSLGELSGAPDRAFRFTLRLQVPPGVEIDRTLLESIIDLEKPAFAACVLELVPVDDPGRRRVADRPGG